MSREDGTGTGKVPRTEELDRFWDIDALLPPKRPLPKSRNTDTVEIRLDAPGSAPHAENFFAPEPQRIPKRQEPAAGQTVVHEISASGGESVIHRYVDPHEEQMRANAPKPDEEYEPQSALIHRVKLFRKKTSYPYYERFLSDAKKLWSVHGSPCAAVPFFSYAPQYSQLNRDQLNWYLWLRECVRNGEYPDTDLSYVRLLIYEILNLAGGEDATGGQAMLCALFANYGDRFPALRGHLSEWICDYSLLNRLPPPTGVGHDLLAQLMSCCRLKEFYVGGCAEDGYLQALFAFCTNYDYHKSKFYPPHAELFDTTVPTVLREVTEYLSGSGKLFSSTGMEDCRMTRDSYALAICSESVQRKIEVSYCSFSGSHELRFLITDVIKYTENKLRAHLGIRSRLTIYALPTAVRERIDTWFESCLPVPPRVEKKSPEPKRAAYEKLYDLPDQTLSFANAAEIERDSWSTTQKLVEAFEEEALTQADVPAAEPEQPEPATTERTEVTYDDTADSASGLGERLCRYRGFLRAVLAENAAAQQSEARVLGSLPDAVADQINEIASEETGDILLEDAGGYYAVIEDYRALLEEMAG